MKYVIIIAICLIVWFLSGFIVWVYVGYTEGYDDTNEAYEFLRLTMTLGGISVIVLIISPIIKIIDLKIVSKLVSKFIDKSDNE